MNKSTRSLIAAAALAGLYAGALAVKASASTNVNPGTQIVGDEKGKDSCKGKDGCKAKDSKESCKGKDGCKAKDSCKGKDGCKAKDSKESCKAKDGCKAKEDPAKSL